MQMQEYKIEIEIDEDGNIKAETKGMVGEVCIGELDDILSGLDGEQSSKNKPEFYQKNVSNKTRIKIQK
jgi:hypothetical protein